MKERLISAAIGLTLLIVVLFFLESILFNIVVGIASLMALYELLLATKYVKNKALTFVSMAFAMTFPFLKFPIISTHFRVIIVTYIFALFIILIIEHEKLHLEHVATVSFVTILLPLAFCTIIFLRDENDGYGLFYILMVFCISWLCDAGAYFVGRAMGKRKLAPKISPNKTIEGAVGGVICNILMVNLAAFIFTLIFDNNGAAFEVNYIVLTIAAVLGAGISMLGDLTASIVKRHCAIKDFGALIPGHGGVLDRFDSVIFVAPFLYLTAQFFPIII